MIEEGTFGFKSNTLPLDKTSYLLDMLEIGRRNYTEVRRLFLTDNIHLPSFGKLSKHRCKVGLVNFFEFINYNYQDISIPIGIGISYRKIVHQTTERLLGTISNSCEWRYPLKLIIADGLDGSGSHRIYNQLTPHPDINTKSFLLFGFIIISLYDSVNPVNRWSNPIPNSPFVLRPVALLTLEENHLNVKFLMDTLINIETANLEDNAGFHTGGCRGGKCSPPLKNLMDKVKRFDLVPAPLKNLHIPNCPPCMQILYETL